MKPKKKEQFDKDAAEDEKYLEEFYKGMANEEPKTNSSPMSNYIPLTLSNLPLRWRKLLQRLPQIWRKQLNVLPKSRAENFQYYQYRFVNAVRKANNEPRNPCQKMQILRGSFNAIFRLKFIFCKPTLSTIFKVKTNFRQPTISTFWNRN